ncbi:MAG: hypothetical protein R2777_04165 [Chitinophagales bacterium]
MEENCQVTITSSETSLDDKGNTIVSLETTDLKSNADYKDFKSKEGLFTPWYISASGSFFYGGGASFELICSR